MESQMESRVEAIATDWPWLDETVKQAKEKYQARRVQEDELIQEETLRRKLAGKFCRVLFAWLETIDVQFNTRFGGHVLTATVVGTEGNRSAKVFSRPIRAQERMAELSYQQDTNCLALSMGFGVSSATQIIKMVRSADGEIFAEIDGQSYTPLQLGQKIIGDLLV